MLEGSEDTNVNEGKFHYLRMSTTAFPPPPPKYMNWPSLRLISGYG